MTELIKLTQEQHKFIQTFNIGVQTNLDRIDKSKAIHHISRWVFGFALIDGNGQEYSYVKPNEERLQAPFKQDERFKIIDAIINGYEVTEPCYYLYTEPYSELTGNKMKVYYLGQHYRMRITSPEEKLKTDWGKTFSLDEANKIIADFKELGVTFELEEVTE